MQCGGAPTLVEVEGMAGCHIDRSSELIHVRRARWIRELTSGRSRRCTAEVRIGGRRISRPTVSRIVAEHRTDSRKLPRMGETLSSLARAVRSVCAKRRGDCLPDRILCSIWRQEHAIVADRHGQPLVRIRPGNGAASTGMANGPRIKADLTA